MSSRLPAIMVLAVAASCSGQDHPETPDGLSVSDIVIGESVLDDIASMYATFRNTGPEDTLRAVLIDGVGRVEIHDQWREGDLTRMEPMPNLIVPEDGTVILQPGERHFMLMSMVRELAVGDSIDIGFRFAAAGLVEVRAPVVSLVDVLSRDPAGGGP